MKSGTTTPTSNIDTTIPADKLASALNGQANQAPTATDSVTSDATTDKLETNKPAPTTNLDQKNNVLSPTPDAPGAKPAADKKPVKSTDDAKKTKTTTPAQPSRIRAAAAAVKNGSVSLAKGIANFFVGIAVGGKNLVVGFGSWVASFFRRSEAASDANTAKTEKKTEAKTDKGANQAKTEPKPVVVDSTDKGEGSSKNNK